MTIAVAGATGALGSRICAELLARGAAVRAFVRDPRSDSARALAAAGAESVTLNLTASPLPPEAVVDVDCVVSTATCFPREDAIETVDRDGNLRLVDAAEAAGVARFVFVSFKPIPLDFPLQRAKRAVEERLCDAALDAVVLRPGKLMDVWFSPLCGFDVAARQATLYGEAAAPVSWMTAADVAEIAARSALGEGPRAGTVELGGPEALTQREVVSTFERVTDSRWRTRTVNVGELERMLTEGENGIVRSLGAVMLEAHLGTTTDPASFLGAFPLRLTSVAEFAAAYSPSG